MPDNEVLAYERALGLVGVTVWEQLSDTTRAKILDEELALLAAEQDEKPTVILT
jgi:hypothetical protein